MAPLVRRATPAHEHVRPVLARQRPSVQGRAQEPAAADGVTEDDGGPVRHHSFAVLLCRCVVPLAVQVPSHRRRSWLFQFRFIVFVLCALGCCGFSFFVVVVLCALGRSSLILFLKEIKRCVCLSPVRRILVAVVCDCKCMSRYACAHARTCMWMAAVGPCRPLGLCCVVP